MNTGFTTHHNKKSQTSHLHIYNIPLHDILFIETRQKKTLIHLKQETLTLSTPLYRLKETLPADLFLQTHRSYLVNLENISHINKQKDSWVVFFFDSDKHAFISRNFRHQLLATIKD